MSKNKRQTEQGSDMISSKKMKIIATVVVALICVLFPSVGNILFGDGGNADNSHTDNDTGIYSEYDKDDVSDTGSKLNSGNSGNIENAGDVEGTKDSNQQTKNPEKSGDDSLFTEGFRNDHLLNSHYEKHGVEMGFSSPEEYEMAAIAVVNNKDALQKIEAEDGDLVYYVEKSNEFVVVSKDGFIRTYFYPSDGIAYFNRQ